MDTTFFFPIIIAILPILLEVIMYDFFDYQDILIGNEMRPKNVHLNRIHAFSFLTLIAVSLLITGFQNIEEKYTRLGILFISMSAVLFYGANPLSVMEYFHKKNKRYFFSFVAIFVICLDLFFIYL